MQATVSSMFNLESDSSGMCEAQSLFPALVGLSSPGDGFESYSSYQFTAVLPFSALVTVMSILMSNLPSGRVASLIALANTLQSDFESDLSSRMLAVCCTGQGIWGLTRISSVIYPRQCSISL